MNEVYIVHSMGRVGSRSVAYSLFVHGLATTHAHYINAPISDKDIQARDLVEFAADHVRFNVITLVRNPVARNLSAYIENHPDDPTCNNFVSKYDHDIPERWFDNEMKGWWGVDVYATPFAIERGWQAYQASHDVRVLVIQLERLNHVWKDAWFAFTQFYDTPVLRRAGNSHSKIKPPLPAGYVEELLRQRFAQHFYSQKDLERFHG